MKNKIKLQNKSFDILDDGGNYINQIRLFLGYFNEIPSIKIVRDIDFKAAQKFVENEFKNEITARNYSETCYKNKKSLAIYFMCLITI